MPVTEQPLSRRSRAAKEAIDSAHAIMVDAVTLMGEMLKQVEKNKGTAGNLPPGPGRGKKIENGGHKSKPPFSAPSPTPTLADVGISKRESSNAQALATIKATKPELHEQVRTGKVKVSAARAEVKREQKRKELAAKIFRHLTPLAYRVPPPPGKLGACQAADACFEPEMRMAADTTNLITLGFVAIELGILEGQLRKLCKRGKVPFGLIRGMRVFDRTDMPVIRNACVEAGYLKPSRTAPAAP